MLNNGYPQNPQQPFRQANQQPFGYAQNCAQQPAQTPQDAMYQQRMQQMPAQFQMAQSAPQRPSASMINGRIVNSPSEIMPKDVPMDGSVGVFPVSDFSIIYAKAWGPDGSIQTIPYRPITQLDNERNAAEQNFQNEVFDRLDKIEKLLNKRAKKAVSDDVE